MTVETGMSSAIEKKSR